MAHKTKKLETKRERRGYGSGSILKRKTCQFLHIRYRVNGKQEEVCSKSTVRQVAEARLRVELSKADQGLTSTQQQRRITYGDLRDGLFQHYRVKEAKSLQTLADGTETIWGIQLLDDFFGYRPKTEADPGNPGPHAVSITIKTMDEFTEKRRAEGYSKAYIKLSKRLLKRMFRLANRVKDALGNSTLAAVPDFEMGEAFQPREDYITEDELFALLDELTEQLRPYVKWLFYQGTRSTETKNITWDQIANLDSDSPVFTPRAELNKTGNAQWKSISEAVAAELRKLKKGADKDQVFDTTDFRRRFENACFKLGYTKMGYQCPNCKNDEITEAQPGGRVCKKCKIPMDYTSIGMTPHGLRRSMVVHYRNLKTPESIIMSMSGHKSLAVYQNYAVSSVQTQRDAQREAQKESEKKREERAKEKVRAIR
jgi:hypothetical protein